MSTFTSVSQILAELNRIEYVDLPLSINFVANDMLLDHQIEGSVMYDLCDHLASLDSEEFANKFGKVEPVDLDGIFDSIINGTNKWGFNADDYDLLSAWYTQLRAEKRTGIINDDEFKELMGNFMHVFMLMKTIDLNSSMMILAMPVPGIPQEGQVVGVCIAQVDKKTREMKLLISVDGDIRNQGLGTSFLNKAMKYASQMGVTRVYINGLSNDPTMMRIAEKRELNVVFAGGQISGNSTITLIDKSLSD